MRDGGRWNIDKRKTGLLRLLTVKLLGGILTEVSPPNEANEFAILGLGQQGRSLEF